MSLGMEPHKVRRDGKPVVYRSDGTGRDTYIVRDNGGLLSQSMQQTLEAKSKVPDFVPMRLVGSRHSSSRKSLTSPVNEKFVHYHSDGTGRDSYVGWNHGGYVNNFNSKNNSESLFRGTLRMHQKMPSTQSSSVLSTTMNSNSVGTASALGAAPATGFNFTNTNFYLSSKQLKQKNEVHRKQAKDSERLSRPKTPIVQVQPQAFSVVDSRYSYYVPTKRVQQMK